MRTAARSRHGRRKLHLRATRRSMAYGPAIAIATAAVFRGTLAVAASSASFQIPNGTLDVAGGVSTSASHVLTSCVGSEIAGSSASSSFRVDSGCGAALKTAGPPTPPVTSVQSIPALSAMSLLLLGALLCVLALRQIRRHNHNSSTATR